MVKNALFVTFPRSGHHILMDCLKAYLGDEMHYCENYTHCNSIPCTDRNTNVQKTHDFDLDVKHDGQLVVVQTRAKQDALESWYELKMREKAIVPNDECKSRFFEDKGGLYDRWMMKWTTNNSFPVIAYEWFVTHPEYTVVGIIRCLTGQDDVDTDRVERIVRDLDVKPRW